MSRKDLKIFRNNKTGYLELTDFQQAIICLINWHEESKWRYDTTWREHLEKKFNVDAWTNTEEVYDTFPYFNPFDWDFQKEHHWS